MSADLLRRAAALMRERVKDAAPSPWREVGDGELLGCFAVVCCGSAEFNVAPAVIPAHADHIASWHPAVALAVADWLDATAKTSAPYRAEFPHAVGVARTYLGEQP